MTSGESDDRGGDVVELRVAYAWEAAGRKGSGKLWCAIARAGRPQMAAPAGGIGDDTPALAPEFEVAVLQEQLQRQIEQYEAEVLSNFHVADTTALRRSVHAVEAGPEEDEPDIDEQEVQKAEAAAKRKNKRRVLFGPDVDELYGNKDDDDGFDLPAKGRKQKKPRGAYPAAIGRLLGAATSAYISHDLPRAVALCFEVIRRAPNIADPYTTVGLIYDSELEDKKRALEFYMLAAHITAKDADKWRQVAEMSLTQNNRKQALYCYTRLLKLQPNDEVALYQRTLMLKEQGDTKRAIEGFLGLLKINKGDPDVILELAELYVHSHQQDRAFAILEEAAQGNDVDCNIINVLADLYMGAGEFEKATKMIKRTMKDRPPLIDISVKSGICALYSGREDQATEHFQMLLAQHPRVYGDLYYSVAEAYATVGNPKEAVSLYEKLMLANDDYNKPSLWSCQARCYLALGILDAACSSYESVLGSSAGNVEAALALADIYAQWGDVDRAIATLDSTLKAAPVGVDGNKHRDPRIVAQLSMMLYENKKLEECVANALPLLLGSSSASVAPVVASGVANDGLPVKKKRDIALAVQDETPADAVLQLQDVQLTPRRKKGDKEKDKDTETTKDDAVMTEAAKETTAEEKERLVRDKIYEVLGETVAVSLAFTSVRALVILKRLPEALSLLQRFTHTPLKVEQRDKLRLLSVGVAFEAGDYKAAYNHARSICSARPNSVAAWNLFSKAVAHLGTFPANHRFLVRLLSKNPDSVPLMLMVGHTAATSGRQLLALQQYLRAFAHSPEEALISLFIGVAYLHQAMNRRVPDRHYHVLQAFTFLYLYYQKRKGDVEACYNLGRAFHHLNLLHLAVPYYEQALKLKSSDGESLRMEAAFNLSSIYLASGNAVLARNTLREYCTV